MVEINKRILNEAYEKFKLFIYYNELLTFNYSKIIDFDKNLDSRMDSLENALMGSEELWEEYKSKALKTVKWRAFPNKIYRSTEIINFNKNNEKLNINSFQDIEFYFESNIEVNIISVLWILFLGKKLDESFLENSYGNRIVREQKSRSDRYRLFNFSNKNYGAWKIEALERSEQLHKSEEDSIIINLNIFKLYNSINFQRENFYSYLDEIELNNNNEFILSRLNEFIIEVIEIYNRKIMMKAKYNNIKREKEEINILPMGFLPSFILVNYYLDDLDRKIKEEINPIYYGRYNNEIIIVDKVLDKFYSEKYKDINNEAFLLDYLTEEIFFLERGKLEKTESYLIVGDRNNDFNNLLLRKDNLTVINIKKSDSEEPIRRLKDNIRKYFEEPKILPEDLELFNGNYSEVFSSINNLIIELKDLRRIKIDESKLERLIEKQLILNKLIEGKYKEVQYEKNRINSNKSLKIEDVLSEEIIINCYKSWENIINCYIIGKKINSLYEFLDLINQAIEKIDISNLNLNKIEKIKLENNIRETLKNHLLEVISRALALIYGKEKGEIIERVEEKIKRKRLTERIDYMIKSKMINMDNSILDIEWFITEKRNLLKDYKGSLAVISNLKDSFLILKELK